MIIVTDFDCDFETSRNYQVFWFHWETKAVDLSSGPIVSELDSNSVGIRQRHNTCVGLIRRRMWAFLTGKLDFRFSENERSVRKARVV